MISRHRMITMAEVAGRQPRGVGHHVPTSGDDSVGGAAGRWGSVSPQWDTIWKPPRTTKWK